MAKILNQFCNILQGQISISRPVFNCTRSYHRRGPSESTRRFNTPTVPKGKVVKFPEHYTIKPLKYHKTGGRDEKGHMVCGMRGGGAKQNFRWVDYVRKETEDGKPLEERVQKILYDPTRTAKIALVTSAERKRYIIATEHMKEGDLIKTSSQLVKGQLNEGDAGPLSKIPLGTLIHNIEMKPGEGGKYCRVAGSCATIVKKTEERVTVQLPSKQSVEVDSACMATIGQVSNCRQIEKHIGSASRLRWLGFRPRSGYKNKKRGQDGRKMNQNEKKIKVIANTSNMKPKVYQMTHA